MVQYEMHLNSVPFLKIKSGQKKVEVRVRDEKRQGIRPGDEIVFISREDGNKFVAEVSGLCWCVDFASLVSVLGWKECGWDKEYEEEKYDEDMQQYYSKQEIEEYGALGIVLRVVG